MPSSNISKFSTDNSGLLTTVADLPYNFKLQYVSVETPLDLSVKTVLGQITPPHSPQRSPLKKRPYHHIVDTDGNDENDTKDSLKNGTIPSIATTTTAISTTTDLPPSKLAKKEVTPNGKQIKVTSMPKTHKSASNSTAKVNDALTTKTSSTTTTTAAAATTVPAANPKEHKRVKAVRKLKFDEKKSSPVSGTIIRALDEIDNNIPHESGDIDPQYNIVEVTDEAKAEIAAIPNVIGAYTCKLCQIEFDDAFCLARHRCSCIVLLEYRCPECGKRFNCPANLASHRRWHKPKDEVMKKSSDSSAGGNDSDENSVQYPCNLCGKFFKRQAYLRKHLVTHTKPNSKTNKRAALSATDSNDGNSNSNCVTSNINGGVSVTTTIPTKTLPVRTTNENCATTNVRSKSVCSDDSVSSSQDSIASSVRFTFNVNQTNGTNQTMILRNDDEIQLPSHSPSHFRMFKSDIFTEEENIAAAALAHLRHAKDSVIRHTTALST